MQVEAPSEMLVGRRGELDELDRALTAVSAGDAICLSVVGEPGIGKTRLLKELCRRARERGHLVLAGRGTEFEQEVPFGLAVDALDRHLSQLSARTLDRLGVERTAELSSVFPALASSDPEPRSGPQVERFRCHDAVLAVLEELAGDVPVVLVLDDLHWADEASIELVSHLLRHWPKAPMLLALAYRPQQAQPRLLRTLGAAVRGDMIKELRLAPLTDEDADRLLGDELDAASRRLVRRESGGNPFYLEELARVIRARPNGRRIPARRGVPTSICDAITEELARLSPSARALLQGGAVTGEPFDRDLAARIADVAEPTSAIDELLQRDLIRAAEAPGRFCFRHPILRRAVYESAGHGWRLAAHGRAAAALAERGASAPARAHHVERSALPGDEEAIRALTEGGHAAAARAPATAARWFELALRLLPEGERGQRRELLVQLAAAQGAMGWISESRAALAKALELVPAERAGAGQEAVVIRGQILGAIAGLDHMLGRRGDARALLDQALEELDDPRSALAGVLKLELAVDHWFAGEWDESAANASEALEAARELDDRSIYAEAAALLALSEYNRGETGRGLACADEAERAVGALSDEELSGRVRVLLCLGHAGAVMERLESGVHHAERGVRIARATGQPQWFVPLQAYVSILRTFQGRLGDAARAAETAHEVAMLLDNPHSLAWALTMRSWVARLSGDIPAAVQAGEEAVKTLAVTSSGLFPWLAACHLGAALIEAGEPDRGLEQVLAGAGGPELASIEPSFRTHWYELLAHGELARRRVDAAENWVARSEAALERFQRPGRTAKALRGRAAVLYTRGDATGAAELAGSAAEIFRRAEHRIDEGRARVLLGRALGRLGDRQRAVQELERAYRELAECGAERHRDEAARELRRLGRRVARPGRRATGGPGLGRLSAREREIGELVTAGMTNREIAASLFLSQRTVETHLSRIFTKLRVSSRAALAGALERERRHDTRTAGRFSRPQTRPVADRR